MNYMGFTIEDAIVIRKGFVDMGGACITHEKVYREMQRPTTTASQRVIFERPKRGQCLGMKDAKYDHIDPETGMPFKGSLMEPGCILMGKTATINIPLSSLTGTAQAKKQLKATRRCVSTMYHGERGFVTNTRAYTNKQGLQVREITILSVRVPIRGNKFSSQHGQKGYGQYAC